LVAQTVVLLTQDEVQALTGYKRPSYQCAWLRERGWTFELGADGRPRIAREHAQRQLGALHSRTDPRLHLPPRHATTPQT
jgi:hypothetical protein